MRKNFMKFLELNSTGKLKPEVKISKYGFILRSIVVKVNEQCSNCLYNLPVSSECGECSTVSAKNGFGICNTKRIR
jgi:hypothetical protein